MEIMSMPTLYNIDRLCRHKLLFVPLSDFLWTLEERWPIRDFFYDVFLSGTFVFSSESTGWHETDSTPFEQLVDDCTCGPSKEMDGSELIYQL